MRRVRRLLDEGFTVEDIASEYNSSVTNIRKTIREYRLLQLAENLSGLTPAEQNALANPDLKTNPYTRFFELGHVKEYMGLSIASNGDAVIAPPRKAFDAKLKLVVKAFLNDGTFDTRTDPEQVFGSDFRKFKNSRKSSPTPKPSGPPPSPSPSPPSAPSPSPPPSGGSVVRPDRFFESLTCRVSDHRIAVVVGEIKKISPETYPISATYLLRTLIELCLRRVIDASGKWSKGHKDPTLTDLVNFALSNRDIFSSKRMGDVIQAAKKQEAFEYLNIVAHQRWMDADPATCKSVANLLRSFIRHIVEQEP